LPSGARVVFEQGGPVCGGVGLGSFADHHSGCEEMVIDLLQVCDSESELSSRRYMSWLTVEQVFCCVVIKLITARCDAVGIMQPQGRRTTFDAFFFNCLQFDRVHSNWIRGHEEDARLINEIPDLSEGSAVPHLPHSVHDMQHRLRP